MYCDPRLLPSHRYFPRGPWWKNAVLYQVYPRSFQDSNGDGIGDIRGILSRMDYLEWLGVDIVWISPIYASPQADGGYDISDYYSIDPLFGTMDDFEELAADIHARGMRLVMDLVVNHTSCEHPWFLASRDPSSDQRSWYYWRDAREGMRPGETGAEPNNWESFFGGPAWTFDPVSGQYYLHLFTPNQPDLNWENPKVRSAIYDMMNWWLEHGVDGFRVDAIDVISKVPGLPDGGPARAPFGVGHENFADGPRLHEFLHEMNVSTLARHPGTFTVGEASNATPESALLLCAPSREEFNMVIHFDHMNAGAEKGKFYPRDLEYGELADIFTRWQEGLGEEGWSALYLENHDQPRALSRFGDPQNAFMSASALATAYMCQRGTPFVYQGQEIGMRGADFSHIGEYRDVESLNHYRLARSAGEDESAVLESLSRISRDNARTPMQWEDAPSVGFTSGSPWINPPSHTHGATVASQMNDPDSLLSYYRALIEARHFLPALSEGIFERLDAGDQRIFAFLRSHEDGEVLILVNLSGESLSPILSFSSHEANSPEPWSLYLGNRAGMRAPDAALEAWEARVYVRG